MKAELNMLGEAPRAYLEKLKASVEGMEDVHASRGSKLSLNERFEQIEGVRINNRSRKGGKTLRFVSAPKQAGSRRQ